MDVYGTKSAILLVCPMLIQVPIDLAKLSQTKVNLEICFG